MSAKISGFSPKCLNNWNRATNGSCWRAFYKMQKTCKAAHTPCLPRGGRQFPYLTYVRVINKNSFMLSAARSQSINGIEINVYLHPTQSRRTPNHTIGCQLDICAFIRDSKCGMIYGGYSSCDLPSRSIICPFEAPAEDMVGFV
jgi:hypothetical protein